MWKYEIIWFVNKGYANFYTIDHSLQYSFVFSASHFSSITLLDYTWVPVQQ